MFSVLSVCLSARGIRVQGPGPVPGGRHSTEMPSCSLLQVAVRLGEFRDLVKEVVRSACRTALLEAGFTPDDYFYDGMESPGLFGGETFFYILHTLVSYRLRN